MAGERGAGQGAGGAIVGSGCESETYHRISGHYGLLGGWIVLASDNSDIWAASSQ